MNRIIKVDKSYPNKKRVSVLLTLFLLALVLTSLFYIWQLNHSGERNLRSAKLFEQSLLKSITKFDYIPSLLVSDSLVLELIDSPAQSHEPLSQRLKFIADQSGVDNLYVLDAMGRAIASNNYQSEESFVGKNYAFRPYFSLAKQTRKKQYYFAKGYTTGVRGFFISEAIIVDDQFLGVVVVKIVLDEWETQWQSSEQNILVADNQGVVILSARSDWTYRSIGQLSAQVVDHITGINQFPNETHNPLYTKAYSTQFFNQAHRDVWSIDGDSYVVNNFPIKRVNWTLYHLDNQRNILFRSVSFLLSSLLITLILFLLWQERSSRLQLRQEARDAERTRRTELQNMLNNIHIGVLVFNQQGKILSMNDHAEHLLKHGNKFDESANIFVQELIDIDIEAIEFDQYLQDDIAVPAYHETQTIYKSATKPKLEKVAIDEISQAIPIMFSVGKISQYDGIVYLMTVINITKRKEVEKELVLVNEFLEEKVEQRTQELRHTQAELMQKNRTTALGNMAATIVHELSQPLAAINSSVAAAQAKVLKENWQGASESIQRLSPLSKKMNNVIGLLKSYSYEDALLVEKVMFAGLVQQAIDVLHDRLQTEKITIDYKNNFPQAIVKVNTIKIDLAISNLLKNAMDAVEGQVDALIEIMVVEHELSVMLIVQDSGNGVEQAVLDKLFNPYFTTKEVGRGMGLGLSITGEVIQEHDGNIEVKNTQKGACFSFSLPIIESESDSDSSLDSVNKV